jgi:7,8-dihydropterin-6-yl-methyl-4-(beta-D-ribofuranosyl)aminobenzene 5'-phosphate synthase
MRVTCLVDDAVKGGRYWGEHGLSLLIQGEHWSVLFDTGQSGTVLLHNVHVAEIDAGKVDAVVLSHGHNDHTGGLSAFLNTTGVLPLYVHPDLFRERFSRQGASTRRIGPAISREEMLQRAQLHESTHPQQVAPGLFTTGEITSRREVEGRSPRHVVQEGANWIPDPYRDDLSLVLQTAGGLVLICGCCHAGLLNTLYHVRAHFAGEVVTVLGGMHLAEADECQLAHIVEALRRMGSPHLYPNHCSGERAYIALANAFRERVSPLRAGSTLELTP